VAAQNQILANRANAQKPTGPRPAECIGASRWRPNSPAMANGKSLVASGIQPANHPHLALNHPHLPANHPHFLAAQVTHGARQLSAAQFPPTERTWEILEITAQLRPNQPEPNLRTAPKFPQRNDPRKWLTARHNSPINASQAPPSFLSSLTAKGCILEQDVMQLVPTHDEVIGLLRKTGGLREGHFEYPNGLHAAEYLQVALTMRHYDAAKILSVGLSRRLRAHTDIRAMIPQLSVVAPATGGLPVAYGVSEALRVKQVYWAERDGSEIMKFRQFLEVQPGEKVLLVDDILRTGKKIKELKTLVESRGGEVVGLAVVIFQPYPEAIKFDPLPFYYLAKIDETFYKDAASCELCKQGIPVTKVTV
jgi:orotate phosphoribosyltransferase